MSSLRLFPRGVAFRIAVGEDHCFVKKFWSRIRKVVIDTEENR